MVLKKDYTIVVSNGFGRLVKSTSFGKIFFIRVSGPDKGFSIEIYTKGNIIYKYENSEYDTIVDQVELPLMGDIDIRITGPDGNYIVALGIEEEKIENLTKYLYIIQT